MSIALVAGVAGGVGAVFLILSVVAVWLMRRQQSYIYKGLMSADTKSLLTTTTMDVPLSDSSQEKPVKGARGRTVPVRPTLLESESSVRVQSDFIMADGSSPTWEDDASEVLFFAFIM
jgi:hypothetical protein